MKGLFALILIIGISAAGAFFIFKGDTRAASDKFKEAIAGSAVVTAAKQADKNKAAFQKSVDESYRQSIALFEATD